MDCNHPFLRYSAIKLAEGQAKGHLIAFCSAEYNAIFGHHEHKQSYTRYTNVNICSNVRLLSFTFLVVSPAAAMKKNKCKASSTTEKEFVFEFKAVTHNCVLKVPLQFPVEENINDLHGRLMLLHKIPCYIENGEISIKQNKKCYFCLWPGRKLPKSVYGNIKPPVAYSTRVGKDMFC